MFLNSTFAAIEADAHRRSLIAQAEHHRLVKLARAGTRVTTPPPRVHPDTVPADIHAENRRYAMSR